jgi:hypothetical protein
MGWTDSHLHQFEKDGEYWGAPDNDEFGDLEILDASEKRLSHALCGLPESRLTHVQK